MAPRPLGTREPAAAGAALAAMRACRTFSDRPPDRAVVRSLFEAARWTGSARNRQPWRWTVCTAGVERQLIASAGYYSGFLAGAPVVAVLGIDRSVGGRDAEFDAGRATQQLLTAAHLAGLGACPATLDPGHAVELRERLAIPPKWHPGWAVGLGHAVTAPPLGPSAIPTGRRPIDDVVDWR